ncbi:MAG: pentapeptide repeat-containing protein [Candidatus Acidiferrales bacterium]
MPSLFRRMLSGHGSKERAAQEEYGGAKNVAVEEPPTAEALVSEATVDAPDPARRSVVTEVDVRPVALDQRGLIRADQLPSAAEALAELFPPEKENDPFLSDATEVENPATDDRADSGELAQEPQQQEEDVRKTVEQPDEKPTANEFAEAAAATAVNDARAKDQPAGGIAEVEAEYTATAGEPATVSGPEENTPMTGVHVSSASEEIDDAPPEIIERVNSAGAGADQSTETAQAQHTREAEDTEIVKAASMAALESPASSGRDWMLEEKLSSHLEWLDSRGNSGLRADLSDADLEGQELIGVKLKFADLHDANLRAADLLLADLRDANLVRADMEDSCLVGANLEAANLEGASLETAMGLVPRQIAGANLRDALLPPQIMVFDAAAKFARASRIAWRCFAPLIPAVLISWLIIWKTKDAQLLTDSAVIPFLHSRTAATAMPTEQIFLLAPLVIFSFYLVFQFQLQKVWQAALELPAIFPDGHSLDDRGPGLIVGLLRAHFWWIGREGSSTMWVEKTISILAGYWAVPFTLTLFWARYLTMQDMKGTLLQALLVAIATGVALHATMRTGRVQVNWAAERKWTGRMVEAMRRVSPAVTASGLGVALLLLSVGTLSGVPHERSRAPQYSAASIRRWAADVLWSFGFDPYADLTEATLSRKPARWTGANAQVASVTGPQLNEAKLRYAQAYGVFLANAHLWQSDFEGAYLSEADLRGADLGNSDLRRAVLDGALLNGANLNRARLDGAVLARADLRWANLSYASLAHAMLMDSRLDGATLYDAQMSSASLARADLKKTDLRGASLNAADLDHADLQQSLLWSAKLPGANLYGAKLQGSVAIDVDLRGADLREAQFAGTVLSDANLSGSNLDRADLRGALELTPSQVCSSKSRRGALLDVALATQVAAECGGLQ